MVTPPEIQNSTRPVWMERLCRQLPSMFNAKVASSDAGSGRSRLYGEHVRKHAVVQDFDREHNTNGMPVGFCEFFSGRRIRTFLITGIPPTLVMVDRLAQPMQSHASSQKCFHQKEHLCLVCQVLSRKTTISKIPALSEMRVSSVMNAVYVPAMTT